AEALASSPAIEVAPGDPVRVEPPPAPRNLPTSAPAVVKLPPETPPPDRRHPLPNAVAGPRFLALSKRLAALVGIVGVTGTVAGILGLVCGGSQDLIGLLAIAALVCIGQALALEVDDGSISVGAVGALTGAALFGPRAALLLAIAMAGVEWSARRSPVHRV